MESKELRELLLYLDADIDFSDIPHRTKLAQMILDAFEGEMKVLTTEMRVRSVP